jgi:hypothetical protein
MPLELDRSLVARLLSFVSPWYRTRDPAHDLEHIKRILGRLPSLSIGVEPAPRAHLLAFLACFHGMAKALRDEPSLAQDTTRLLSELGWLEADKTEALAMVPRHLADPRTSEEKVVHDANYVELFGALGIAKAFTTGGAQGQSYLQTLAILENQYLDRVVLKTPAGREIADRDRSYVKAFLRRLERELSSVAWPR